MLKNMIIMVALTVLTMGAFSTAASVVQVAGGSRADRLMARTDAVQPVDEAQRSDGVRQMAEVRQTAAQRTSVVVRLLRW